MCSWPRGKAQQWHHEKTGLSLGLPRTSQTPACSILQGQVSINIAQQRHRTAHDHCNQEVLSCWGFEARPRDGSLFLFVFPVSLIVVCSTLGISEFLSRLKKKKKESSWCYVPLSLSHFRHFLVIPAMCLTVGWLPGIPQWNMTNAVPLPDAQSLRAL